MLSSSLSKPPSLPPRETEERGVWELGSTFSAIDNRVATLVHGEGYSRDISLLLCPSKIFMQGDENDLS